MNITMQRTITYVCVCVCVASGRAGELRCVEPMERCSRVIGKEQSSNEDQFTVEDKIINIRYEEGRYLDLDCYGWAALDSSALPCFTREIRVPKVTLRKCPPPAAGGSFTLTLAKLNVTLQRSSTQSELNLEDLPVSEPPLNANHFTGLDDLVQLKIDGKCTKSRNQTCDRPTPSPGFLLKLRTTYLKTLKITNLNLSSQPPKLLDTASALEVLSLTECQLKNLSWELMADMSNLLSLNLSDNELRKLPSGMFASTARLQTLNLSNNLFVTQTVSKDDDVGKVLGGLRSLKKINLDYNPHLGDLCDVTFGIGDYSSLLDLNLTYLSLSNTNISVICCDWREQMRFLEILNLTHTAKSILLYTDLVYKRDKSITNAKVLLDGIHSVKFTENNYNKSIVSDAKVLLNLNSRLKCDCQMFWTRLALVTTNNSTRVPTLLSELRCSDGRLLREISPDELVCRNDIRCSKAQAPTTCSCTEQPEPGMRILVRVHCEGALTERNVPKLTDFENVIYHLLLANNTISNLSISDLPSQWKELDVRNNSLELVDEETAWELMRSPRRVLLAGNPLACNCSAAPLLLALHSAGDNASDLRVATCGGKAGGRPLYDAPTTHCVHLPLAAWLAMGLAVLLLITAAVVAYFAPTKRRVLIKILMHKLGLRQLPPEPPAPEGGFLFDAFVCFSHKDEKTMEQLVKKLETGPNSYCVCVHYRDWVPGQRITDQIRESIQGSRRTVVLASQAFFKSNWTKAEFDEAYTLAFCDASPRLVVVLLEDPDNLPLDNEFQRYLSTITYLRWGNFWFWEEMRLAMGSPLPLPARTNSAPAQAPSSSHAPSIAARPLIEQPLSDDRMSESRESAEPTPVCSSPEMAHVTSAPEQLSLGAPCSDTERGGRGVECIPHLPRNI